MDDLRHLILSLTPTPGSIEKHRLHSLCAERMRRAIRDPEFEAAIDDLAHAGDISVDEDRVRRVEPDFAERELEASVEAHLRSETCIAALKVESQQMIFHRTATGGAQGTGLFSRPDFTMAAIRRLKYDPLRRLDVITFELKNSAGATLLAVHEALAHTRFAHYSYLVCPRSRLSPADTSRVRHACAEHGIGLILFTIDSPAPPPRIRDFAFELRAVRKAPDPYVVEEFLEARLPTNQLERLKGIAGS